MKRVLIIFITAAMLLAGCNGNAAESSGASQEPHSSQEENIPEESESPAQEPAESEDAPFAEDEASIISFKIIEMSGFADYLC